MVRRNPSTFNAVQSMLDRQKLKEYRSRPAERETLSSTDAGSLLAAPDVRTAPIKNLAQIEDMLNRRNNVRLWRMRRDYKWCQKQMLKMGLNPEDARQLLP